MKQLLLTLFCALTASQISGGFIETCHSKGKVHLGRQIRRRLDMSWLDVMLLIADDVEDIFSDCEKRPIIGNLRNLAELFFNSVKNCSSSIFKEPNILIAPAKSLSIDMGCVTLIKPRIYNLLMVIKNPLIEVKKWLENEYCNTNKTNLNNKSTCPMVEIVVKALDFVEDIHSKSEEFEENVYIMLLGQQCSGATEEKCRMLDKQLEQTVGSLNDGIALIPGCIKQNFMNHKTYIELCKKKD